MQGCFNAYRGKRTEVGGRSETAGEQKLFIDNHLSDKKFFGELKALPAGSRLFFRKQQTEDKNSGVRSLEKNLIALLSSLKIILVHPPSENLPPLERLRAIVSALRGPEGCPWDREQTHASLRKCVVEEGSEVVAAIDAGDDANLCEELGDLLLQVVFHAQIATEEGRFNFEDVARGIAEKLVRRHPHVFGTEHCADSAEVLLKWDEIKRAEKAGRAHAAPAKTPAGEDADRKKGR